MPPVCSEIQLVNGSVGDPLLFVDYPGKNDALLFDAGENSRLSQKQLADLEAVFITHHHIDHFVGFDRIIRANLDAAKTLTVFGPAGTIEKVYQRVTSYEHPFFPFQKIVFEIVEVVPASSGTSSGESSGPRLRRGYLECSRRFAEPTVQESTWEPPVIYNNALLQVEAVAADHTVPCLAYALVERPGAHPDRKKLENGILRPGRWIGHVQRMVAQGTPGETTLEVGGGQFTLTQLLDGYFRTSRGARIAYVTDTFWSEEVREGLLRLARRANQLYCDSFYLEADAKRAEKHRHMTAARTAEFAAAAKVDQLILMHFSARYANKYHQLLEEAQAIFPKTTWVPENTSGS